MYVFLLAIKLDTSKYLYKYEQGEEVKIYRKLTHAAVFS